MKIRPEVAAMSGYAPGEQPADIESWIKLNTNENPYPPSPRCHEAAQSFAFDRLRRYPNATADELRDAIADLFMVTREQVIAGNGSDDILNLTMRLFVGSGESMAMVTPSYSLYASLAEIQGAACRKIQLNPDFSLPDNFAEEVKMCRLLMIPNPNAPTGLPFPIASLKQICDTFSGAVLIDEAYADFADDSAIQLLKSCPNVIISRTMSKSYALAGLRVGFAIASPEIISELMKVKDSYNLGHLPQVIAAAAIKDQDYLRKTVAAIRTERTNLSAVLKDLNFEVVPSATNFIFAAPPDRDGKRCYETLKSHKILVRWFAGPVTGQYVRITIGTPAEMETLIRHLKEMYA